jgi:glutaredoxin
VKKLLNQIIKNYTGIDMEVVDIADDSSRAEEYGIISVPSIVINGELCYSGEVPDSTELEHTIKQELE